MTTTASASRIVLVVDDDDDIRSAVQEVLEEEGYATQGAANGKQALDLLRTSNDLPALVLLDLMMPEMDGWELLVRLAEDAALSQIPVALMSAHPSIRQAFDNDRQKFVGASMLLPKPINLLRLLSVVERAVNAEEQRPS